MKDLRLQIADCRLQIDNCRLRARRESLCNLQSAICNSKWLGLVALLATVLWAPTTAVAAEPPEVLAELGRRRIYEGESVQYVVTLNHVKDPSPPQLKGFDDFNVVLLGTAPQNFRQTININGRVTTIERYGMRYTYRLTPRRAGDLTVPAPIAKVGGKTLYGPELALIVLAPQQQDVAILEITCKPESVYPMQPFEVTLSVLVKDLPEPYADRDPVSVQRAIRSAPVALEIPWAIDKHLPEGLQPRRGGERWREALRSPGGAGFSMNSIAVRDPLSLFDDDFDSFFRRGFPFGNDSPLMRGPRLVVFEPQPSRVMRKDEYGRDTGYWRYEFRRRFIPKQIGRYEFGPVSLKGKFLTEISSADRAEVEDVYAVAPAITVTVKDVPEENQPESYIGAVGEFQFGAELTPKKARVGDPMTLTLTLCGEGTLHSAYPPDLMKVAGIGEDFKVYEATESGQGDTREFTYSLRPLREGIEQFPSVPVSYFDVNKERYVTLRSEPIPIKVGKADRLASNQIVAARGLPGRNSRGVEVRKEGIFANVTDLGALGDEAIRPGRWLGALGGMAGLYFAIAAVVAVARRRRGDIARQRRQAAASRAHARLRQAKAELKADRAGQCAEHVRAALTGLVADMADLPEAGLTPRDVEKQLETSGVEKKLSDRVGAVLERCDAARYGATDMAVGNLAREAGALLKPLAEQLRSKRRFR